MKLLNDELPIQYIWYQRRLDLYKSDLYFFYKITKEDNVHIFTCNKKTYIIQSQFKNMMLRKLKQFCLSEKDLWKNIKTLDTEWLNINEQQLNNEVSSDTKFSLIETIKD